MICNCCQSDKISIQFFGHNKMYKCRNCGLFYQARKKEQADGRQLIKHYQNHDPHYEVARSKQIFFNSALHHLSSKIKKSDRAILDIGCGFGYFLDVAAQKGWATFGVEIVSQAACRAADNHGEKNIYHGKFEEADYPADFFDAVTLWDVLFTVENPYEVLEECYRVMKPGAAIGIRVRNIIFQRLAFSILFPFRKILAGLGVKQPYVFHPYCFSANAVRILLLRLGYTEIQTFNAVLTDGDPYQYSGNRKTVANIKRLVALLSNFIFVATRQKLVLGPSLLVWAHKPE
jgi:SAM-dependent methyltransferase